MKVKKRLLPIITAMLMAFTIIPMIAGIAYAEADVDTTSPTIVPNSLTVSISGGKEKATVGDTVTFSLEVNDDRAISNVRINLYTPITHHSVDFDFTYAGDDPETKNGIWQGTYTVTDESENGLWVPRVVGVHDTSGNGCSVWTEDLTAWNFTVEGTNADPDVTSPIIVPNSLTVNISGGKEKATVGDTVTFSLEVNDDRAISNVRINLYTPITHHSVDFDFTYAGDDPETKNGIWQGTYTVTDESENGLWVPRVVGVHDTSGNGCSVWTEDLTAWNFTVVAPECPLDLTTAGYSMMLDGTGATTTFGGNYYVDRVDDTVTPTVKVRFDGDDGWTTLAPRKYTLKYEKKTGESTWENYTADTFGLDETGTTTYRVSAIGKESLYYTGTVGPVEFNVIQKCKLAFDTNEGSEIAPQYVIPGGKATKPENPTKDNYYFSEWYADENLTEPFNFDTAINEDITIYAKWTQAVTFTVGVYDRTNSKTGQGGTYTFNDEDMTHTVGKHSAPQGSQVTLVAAPAEGYMFAGWYLSEVTDSDNGLIISRLGECITTESTFQCEAVPVNAGACICAVFRESSDTPPEIDISTLQIQPPEARKSDRVVTEGDSINVSIKITDNGTVKKALAWFLTDYQPTSSEIAVKKITLSKQENDIWAGTLQIDKNTDIGKWELGYVEADDNNNNNVGYYNSSSYYEEEFSPYTDLSAFDFTVEKSFLVTFDTRGGSEIAPQRVIKGRKAVKPEEPVKDNLHFNSWYSDEELSNSYWFSNAVNDHFTLYAEWYAYMALGVYNKSNPSNHQCGTVDIETAKSEASHSDAKTINFTAPEGSVKFTANPAEGYTFKGWYKGVVGSSHYVEAPSEELLAEDLEYTCDAGDTAICAVFECTEHKWKQTVRKATPAADGQICQVCTVCGAEKDVEIIPKANGYKLSAKTYTYKAKARKPAVKVADANGNVVDASNYTVTYSNNIKVGTKAAAKVTFKGDRYTGSKTLYFTIKKAANTLKIKARKATVKKSAVKKKIQYLDVTKVIAFTSKGQGAKTYVKKSGNKKITIAQKTGKVTVKKGLKKGTYKVKVRIKAAGNSNYKASTWKTVTFTIIVR